MKQMAHNQSDIEVFPGKDGEVRVAMVKTATGIYERSSMKLAPLITQEEEVQRQSSLGRHDVRTENTSIC